MIGSKKDPDYLNGIGEVGLVKPKEFVDDTPFQFERGGEIASINLRYETYGQLAADKENAILICHALTGDHHCAGVHSPEDAKPGWWNQVIGPGKAIDTKRFFVICSNCLGACQGSTGPTSVNEATGKTYGISFPELTIGDMVFAQKRLVKHLGIEKLYAVVGGSMGGMQALQWAVSCPELVARTVVIAATTRHNAQTIAFNDVGRAAIQGDPEWNGGDYPSGGGPEVGLAIARMMAHITYLSGKGMEQKFGRSRREQIDGDATKSIEAHFGIEFEVESYLRHQGKTFVNRFDANTYLHLTKALDRFDLHAEKGGLEQSLNRINARTLAVGFTSDWLYTPKQNREIAETLQCLGKDASYAEIDHDFGHDSFLLKSERFHRLIQVFLEGADQRELDRQSARPDSITRTEAKKEADFRVIDEWVGQGESVLDLGCGRGILLEHLAKTKQVRGLGVDIDIEKVIGCVSRAAPIYQGDVRKTLAGFPDDSFDWIVFSRTMEELNNPCEVIEKALHVAKRVVVSFVNHGYWRNRLHYFLNGSRIINDVYDKAWHERAPINPIAIRDFENFCRDRNLVLRRRVCLGGDWKTHRRVFPNLLAGVAIYEVGRN